MMRSAVLFMAALMAAAPAVHAASEDAGYTDARSGRSSMIMEKDKDGNLRPKFAYIDLKSVTLPIITSRGLTQQLSVMIALEVPVAQEQEVRAYMPRLIDAYIQELYGALGSGVALSTNGIVNIAEIKKRLTDTTARVLGPDGLAVSNVLLQVVQQQPK